MHPVRILAESTNPARNLPDAATGNRLFWWRGSSLAISIALTRNGTFLVAADIGTVIVEVKQIGASPADASLMRKTYGAADCDATFTAADWAGGAKQLLTATFTATEANLLPSSYLIIIRHEGFGGNKETFAVSEIQVMEDSSESPSISTPPAPAIEYWTKLEADSRYGRSEANQPLILSSPPSSAAPGTITGTLSPDATGTFEQVENYFPEFSEISYPQYSTGATGTTYPATRIYYTGAAWEMTYHSTGSFLPFAAWRSSDVTLELAPHPGLATGWTPVAGLFGTPTGTPVVTYSPASIGWTAIVNGTDYYINFGTLAVPNWIKAPSHSSGEARSSVALSGNATQIPNVSQVLALPPGLRSYRWDYAQGGMCSMMPYYPSWTGVYAYAFGGLLLSNVGISPNAGSDNSIAFFFEAVGLTPTCLKSGSIRGNAVGLIFMSVATPAGAHPTVTPSVPAIRQRLMRVRVPTLAKRAGRLHYISAYPYSLALEKTAGLVNLFFNATDNSLRFEEGTGAAFTTASAATGAFSQASGNFTAFSITDATREILIRHTVTAGGAETLEIASYSSAPVFQTVVSITSGFMIPGLAVCSAGTGAGDDLFDSFPNLVSVHVAGQF